tara:strand:+ start:3037 stop:3507 length:471 start_codon:yes stop_codon:yes gene_type:complete
MDDKQIDSEINSLVNQLKDNNHMSKDIDKKSVELSVSKDNLEEFVIDRSSRLINQSLDVMDNLKDYIMASNDPDSISALADLIKASSSSIDSLNKIVVQNKRSATTLVAKQMDIESRKEQEVVDPHKLIGTREEVFKKIMEQAKVIDIDEKSSLDP